MTRYTSGTTPTSFRFTGQRSEMDGIGLYHYGARWYSPSLGRFISADSIIPDPGDPLAFDRYSYVLNNPLVYVDLSGHGYCDNNNQYNAEGVSCDMTAQEILETYYDVIFDDATEWGRDRIHEVYIAIQTVGAAFAQ